MRNTMLLLLFFLFVDGVSGAETDETMSVMEGDSVTLHTDLTEIQNDDTLMWMFGPEENFISQITRKDHFTSFGYTNDDARFRGRLQVDQNTGSLTIRNTRIRHSGQYKLSISRGRTTFKIFNVTVQDVVSGTDEEKSKSVSVEEGKSVTLNPDPSKIHGDEMILWICGDKGFLIAKIDLETKKTSLNNANEGFRDRLELDQTGSLTITNTRTTDSGLYELQIRGSESSQQFILTVKSSGLSVGAVIGIVLLVSTVAAGVIYMWCDRYKISQKLQKLMPVMISVEEGENATLNHTNKIQKDDLILWMFGDENKLIAQMMEQTGKSTYTGADKRFINKLQLDKNGYLTIKSITNEHAGNYKLQMSNSRRTIEKKFCVGVRVNVLSVMDGDEVRLNTGAEIQTDDEIKWRFWSNTIARLKGETRETHGGPNERFKDRLTVDNKTGDLTIKNIRPEHSGEYLLEISRSSRETTYRRYIVHFKVENKNATLGESVTLNPDNEIQRDDDIKWMFGDDNILIARRMGQGDIEYTGADKRFKDILQLDKTGSLTIKNITDEHVGDYKLEICSSREIMKKKFRVAIQVSILSVNDGDEASLNTGAEIQTDDEIEWRFETEKSPIAEIKNRNGVTHDGPDGRFRDRLKLDEMTGSLTITNIRPIHDGVYRVKISGSRGTKYKSFIVTVTVRVLSVMERDNVFIDTYTKIQKDDLILWKFGDEDNLIAQMTGEIPKIFGGPNEIFREKLILDQKTGSLTIKNSTIKHSGLYKLQISNSRGTKYREIDVKIHETSEPAANSRRSEEIQGKHVNKLKTEVTPMLERDDLDVVNEQEGTSSL